MGSGFNFFANAIDITPATIDAWTDVDVSAHIPAGSTGVILDLHCTVAQLYVSVRKNGSTDDRSANHRLSANVHRGAWIGVDANRIFEAKIDTADAKIWLVGYTDENVTFETNAIDKSLGTTGAWTDIDISANAPSGSTGVICEIVNTHATSHYIGVIRKNGSSDDRTANSKVRAKHCVYGLCGLDASYIFEGYIEAVDVDFYVVGYTKAPIVFFTNAIDKSLTITGSWLDIDLTADTEAAADGAIWQIHNLAAAIRYGELRKNGSSDDRSASAGLLANCHCCLGVGLDTDNICEGYISDTTVDFYLMGYCKPAGATYTKNYNADVLLKKLDIPKTYLSDVLLLKQGIIKTYSADTLLQQQGITKTYLADVLLLKELTKVYSTDLLLKKLDITKTYTADVILGVPSHAKQYIADVLLKKLDITKTYSADVIIGGVAPWAGLFGELEITHSEAEVSIISPLGTMEVKIPTGELEIIKR